MARILCIDPSIHRAALLALPCALSFFLLAGCDTASSPQRYSEPGLNSPRQGNGELGTNRSKPGATSTGQSGRTEKRSVELADAAGYIIQPGDLLLISVSGEPDFNQQVRVDWNGQINLPYLTGRGRSEIRASGLNASELAERITQFAQHSNVLNNPRIQVLITEYANQMFVVLGQVNQPGRYAFPRGVPPRMDLEDAIGTGGGYTRLARESLILVKRGTQVYKVDLRRMTTRSGEPRFIVLPGDVITVTERLF